MNYGQTTVGIKAVSGDPRIEKKEDSQIAGAMCRLQLAVERAEVLAKEVHTQLQPVLSNHPVPSADEKESDGRNGQCDLASSIHGACKRLESLNRHWEDIRQRCEV